jgi:hypothetical protein
VLFAWLLGRSAVSPGFGLVFAAFLAASPMQMVWARLGGLRIGTTAHLLLVLWLSHRAGARRSATIALIAAVGAWVSLYHYFAARVTIPEVDAVGAGLRCFAVHRKSCFPPRVPNAVDDGRALQTEGRALARYLVGRIPPQELIDRYEQANRALSTEPIDRRDAAVVGFVARHPWSLPFLDAGAGLLGPGSLLRNKILLMAAILETSPAFADEFLPRNVGPATLILRLVTLGMVAAVQAVLGAVLYAAVTRLRHD